MESRYEFEYLVKFKSMSYLHVKWLTANEIGTVFDFFNTFQILW